MSKFNSEWNAVCPKCDKKLSHDDFVCKNCGKGKIKAQVIGGPYVDYYGCENCEAMITMGIICPACNASVQQIQVKKKR